MQSTAYSVTMTLLLLVPIAAVPLMAIFGVPQFTPAVSSPLDVAEDDDDWDRPARKKSRSIARVESDEEADDDIPADEALEWNDVSEERPAPLRKRRAPPRSSPPEEEVEQSFAESDGFEDEPAPPKSKTRPRAVPEKSASSIRQVSNEEIADEVASGVESAVHLDAEPPSELMGLEDAAKIPGYRRQKSGSRAEGEKSPAGKSRAAASSETLSWQKLTQRLNDYGIRNFRLESGEQPGEFTFTCTYTPSNSPHVTRKFEAVADDPLKAVAKVLAQVEEVSQQKVLASPRRMTESRTSDRAE